MITSVETSGESTFAKIFVVAIISTYLSIPNICVPSEKSTIQMTSSVSTIFFKAKAK